jgi:hypothetical protein
VTNMHQNPNCSGDRCVSSTGEVRVYPLGGGGNQIFCMACFANENAFRYRRGRETREPQNWPIVTWADAEVYQS